MLLARGVRTGTAAPGVRRGAGPGGPRCPGVLGRSQPVPDLLGPRVPRRLGAVHVGVRDRRVPGRAGDPARGRRGPEPVHVPPTGRARSSGRRMAGGRGGPRGRTHPVAPPGRPRQLTTPSALVGTVDGSYC